MRLLMYQVEQQLRASGFAPEVRLLDTNYRTAGEIVRFNNRLFRDAAALIGGFFGEEGRLRLEQAYGQAAQQARHAGRPGYVEIQWFDERGEDAAQDWREQALERTCGLIREICADGFRGGDITLLVRTNADGVAVAVALQEAGIKVVSAESLLLRSHPAVQLLLAVLEYLRDPQAPLPAAALARYHGLLAGHAHPAFHEPLALPAWLTLNADRLLRMPVHSCLMEVIRLEPSVPGSDAYVQGLLEAALEYTGARDPGISGFLEWWADQAGTRAIAASPDPDAVQIMTIHKAKGLEFPVVILPLANWQLGVSSRELVWADASETGSPFPRLPVRMTLSLEKTVFAPVYAQEQLDSYLDNLNLLYVACTRPEYRLYVLSAFRRSAGAPKAAQCPGRAGELLRQVLGADAGAAGAVMRFGEPVSWEALRKEAGTEARALRAPLELPPRTAGRQPWQQRIRVRTLSGRFLGEALLDQQQRIQAGELLHAALARIRTAADLPAALEFLRMQGLAQAEALPELAGRLERLIGSGQVKDWFSGAWEVRNEAALIRPDGSVLRPDRVMIRGQEAVVVDYKTGAPRPSHLRQVQAYLDAVQEAGIPQVSGYLYYLVQDSLVPVGAGRLF
ncbi:MAG: 3'-5' exonuclease [Bacteroidia bacterium]|nr:3'-5' exonuclease [Bacteroidia bacterium]